MSLTEYLCIAGGFTTVYAETETIEDPRHTYPFELPLEGTQYHGVCSPPPTCKYSNICTKKVHYIATKDSKLPFSVITHIPFTKMNAREDIFLYTDLVTTNPKEFYGE